MPSRAPPLIIQIPHELGRGRADKILAETLAGRLEEPALSRSRLKGLFEDGAVKIDGALGRPTQALEGGETVEIVLPEPVPSELKPEPMPLDVIFEDSSIIVVNKPTGLVVHPGAGHSSGTLVHGLLAHCHDLSGIGGTLRPGIVHRLDAGTTGVMVVAKNDLAHEALAKQFSARSVKKSYSAFVFGKVEELTATIKTLYARHPKHRKKFSGRVTRGKEAITTFTRVARAGEVAQLDVRIETGRTHQIRVHLSEAGYPILGDPLYGGQRWKRLPAGPIRGSIENLQAQALHARQLELVHPQTDEPMVFTAPFPQVLQRLQSAMSSQVE